MSNARDTSNGPDTSQKAEATRKAAQSAEKRGVLAYFAGHRVASNLLMIFVMLSGVLSLLSITVEVFPTFSLDTVTIRVPYLGASPAETEEGVCVRVEEAIASLEGIKKLRSTASEGVGVVIAELEEGADSRRVLDDIKNAVDRIDTFPTETEKPVISEVVTRKQVINVVLHGEVSQKALTALAEQVRDDLTALDGITQVEVQGVPSYEISIEVSESALRRYGLTFDQVAAAIRGASLDLPGGAVKTDGGEILLRTNGQKYGADEFEDIVVVTRNDGTRLLLGDLATVIDGFEDADIVSRFDGEPAALVQVFRTGDEGALEVAAMVKDYIEVKSPELPAGVSIATWGDRSVILGQRIGLLIKNARLGLLLVFICLALFLDFRLAFWTTMGIPISFLGGLWLIPNFGVTINMISLFAFIVSLGIVVDDAIIVGENIFAQLQKGLKPIDAAIAGVREMAVPVTFAILTSIAAFLPLVFVMGTMGKVMKQIPFVVIMVLLMSLIESLLILPAHLATASGTPKPLSWLLIPFRPLIAILTWAQRTVSEGLRRFVAGPYSRFLERALEWRYLTIATAVSILLLAAATVAGGFVKFTLMPSVDSDNMTAFLTLAQGTPVEQTEEVIRQIEQAALEVAAEIDAESTSETPLVRHVSITVGEQPSSGGSGPVPMGAQSGSGSHLAECNVELLAGEVRGISSTELANRWRDRVGEVAGAVSLTYTSSIFSAGDAISVQLAHEDFDQLLRSADRLKSILGEYPGVGEIADSFMPGKKELQLHLTDEGRAAGLTLASLARQIRQGFYGEEVQRIQRGRDDLRVMLRYPESERSSSGDLEQTRIRLQDGSEVPFESVARYEEGRGFAAIDRNNRRRVVTVTAAVDESVANANQINAELRAEVLPRLISDMPGLVYSFEGEQKEQSESFSSLGRNFIVALVAIFGLLAVPFRSYSQPLIVMSAIPFGFVGAIAGHLLMGMNLSLLSFFGMVALTGVVVNDSLIMVDMINRQRREGMSLDIAIRESGKRRFRPILLTTLTTFFGLTPMILETSLQARFLIPMAISLGFGVLFATAVTLLLVPVIYRILEDIHDLFGVGDPELVAPAEARDAYEDPEPSPA